jgi:hypothetical protein
MDGMRGYLVFIILDAKGLERAVDHTLFVPELFEPV